MSAIARVGKMTIDHYFSRYIVQTGRILNTWRYHHSWLQVTTLSLWIRITQAVNHELFFSINLSTHQQQHRRCFSDRLLVTIDWSKISHDHDNLCLDSMILIPIQQLTANTDNCSKQHNCSHVWFCIGSKLSVSRIDLVSDCGPFGPLWQIPNSYKASCC